MQKLTIAIPTFERSAGLEAAILSIFSELDKISFNVKKNISIVISDNTISEENFKRNLEFVNEIKKKHANVSYYKNAYNVGATMNVLKCMEYADNGWVWIIGDDDLILPNSLSNILKLITDFPLLGSISFCSCVDFNDAPQKIESLPDKVICENVTEFLSTVEFNNAGFLPSNLFNCKYYSDYSDKIYEWQVTKYPHLVYTLLCLDAGIRCLVTNLVVVASKPPTWNRDEVDSRLFLFKHLPYTKINSVIFTEKFIYKMAPTFKTKLSFYYRKLDPNSVNSRTNFVSIFKYISAKPGVEFYFFSALKNIYNKLLGRNKSL